ncbi:NAD(P)-dependent dehydrogenase (short-subunit alcohol dehydrogenase family) [Agromyces hippuratus]|uniref:NAD(P)-dependent dehydrogenase (Short-subunit alcohol dehydrogenase family) n=1 Tax=Agromyces hippuratus TaxID=286438 RepID=A0A852WT23_9MICO|nr:SDR family NAD(P)-dependent oxidoreductase [Agromyces hippuratus]NYG21412.1 NAD(P)-dependent dehydrogenase (short-subunit alcohol dehydrogenase family) [Agromyces hippuratus]
MSWYPAAMPSQAGKRYLVTGANAGIGFFTAARLAGAGAHVVLAGRSPERLEAAMAAIRGARPEASVEPLVIDVASLASVRAGAARLLHRPSFDGVVANAGMVHTPATRLESPDGNELVLATNVLGHFALLEQLLGHLAPGARIVTLGSLSSRLSTFRIDDLQQLEHGYDSWRAYAQSKIATQVFAFELDRRLRAADAPVASIVAHPGYSTGGRTPRVPGVNEPSTAKRFRDALQAAWAQGKHRGAEVPLHALTAPGVEGGQFWGPRWTTKGPPALQTPTRTSTDAAIGARFWAFAEDATRTTFTVGA